MAKTEQSLLSTPLHGLYIPAGLLVFGTAIVQREYVPYSIALAAILVAFKIYRGQPRVVLKPEQYQEFELKEKTVLNSNVAIYKFALPRPNDILGLPIGQHVQIMAKIDGNEVARSYTPISSDDDRGSFSLLIKSYPTGNISKHIATLKIGETINVRGPKGKFVYTPGLVKRFGMIAGGTGITPMLQIIRAITSNPEDKTEVDLIFANVGIEDIILKEDLDELAKAHPNFRVHYVLNNPPEGWTGGVGFVTADMIKEKLPAPGPDMKLLLCGPLPMISAMRKASASVGFEQVKGLSKLEHQVFCF